MAQWIVKRDVDCLGPVSGPELKKLVNNGNLKALDLVRREGEQEWKSAGRLKGLFSRQVNLDTPPPLPCEINAETEQPKEGAMKSLIRRRFATVLFLLVCGVAGTLFYVGPEWLLGKATKHPDRLDLEQTVNNARGVQRDQVERPRILDALEGEVDSAPAILKGSTQLFAEMVAAYEPVADAVERENFVVAKKAEKEFQAFVESLVGRTATWQAEVFGTVIRDDHPVVEVVSEQEHRYPNYKNFHISIVFLPKGVKSPQGGFRGPWEPQASVSRLVVGTSVTLGTAEQVSSGDELFVSGEVSGYDFHQNYLYVTNSVVEEP